MVGPHRTDLAMLAWAGETCERERSVKFVYGQGGKARTGTCIEYVYVNFILKPMFWSRLDTTYRAEVHDIFNG